MQPQRACPGFARKLRVNCAGIKTDRDFQMLIREMTLPAGSAAADAPEFSTMDPRPQRSPHKKPLISRLDAAAQDLNAILLVLEIGLAVLDFTGFFAIEVRNAVPRMATQSSGSVAPATAAIPPAENGGGG